MDINVDGEKINLFHRLIVSDCLNFIDSFHEKRNLACIRIKESFTSWKKNFWMVSIVMLPMEEEEMKCRSWKVDLELYDNYLRMSNDG